MNSKHTHADDNDDNGPAEVGIGSVSAVGVRVESESDVGFVHSFMLMLTSILLLHIAIQDGSPQPWIEWVELLATLAIAGLAYRLFRFKREDRTASVSQRHLSNSPKHDTVVTRTSRAGAPRLMTHSLPSIRQFAFLLAFFLLPFITDIILRLTVAHGNPLEIQLTLAIRNLMFGLVVLPGSNTDRLAVFTSLFIAIYGALVTVSTATYALLAAYALLGLWWLMGDYWRRLSARFPDESTTEIPYFARVGAIVTVLFFLVGGALAVQTDAVTSAVQGFLPSSGGTGGNDPFARGGVGDGDQMVGAKEDASSFGPVESELFLESKQPTLYDMYIDNYEVAAPVKRDMRSRAIPLSTDEVQKQNHSKLAQNKKSSREFSAVRRESNNRKRQQLDDINSRALLYVAGRTPLHLGLAIFDHWDGRKLLLQGDQPELPMELKADESQRNWATWPHEPAGDIYVLEQHTLKITNLKTPTIPAPPMMTGTLIDKLHDANFFSWENGMLRLRSDRIPSLTVLHVKSKLLRRERINEISLSRSDVAPETSERLEQLAAEWTTGATLDWERVQRVSEALRKLRHDPNAFVPEDTSDALEHFLCESQRGPDFLFATSAAVLLRSQGYHTRVVSGLYADPDNYDRMARATAVFAEDVHFWAEVQSSQGEWIPVEATPGYRLLYARQTLIQRLSGFMAAILRWVLARPVTCCLVIIAVVSGVLLRHRIYALAATSWWRIGLDGTPRQQVLVSVRLLQRLATGQPARRQTGQTIDQWIATLGEASDDSRALKEFRSLVSWASYSTSDRPGFPTAPVRQICVESVNMLRESL